MSVTYEVIPLPSMEGSPPCECLIPEETCGKPAVSRVFGRCVRCGNHGHVFACKACSRDLLTGAAGCINCGSLGCISGSES